MLISEEPDEVQNFKMLGPGWLRTAAPHLDKARHFVDREISIDLSQIGFVTLFDWVSTVAMFERILSNPHVGTISVDLIGDSSQKVMPAQDYINALHQRSWNLDYTKGDFLLSDRVYQLLGFIEALGTRNTLNNRGTRTATIFYPNVKVTDVNLRSFHTRKDPEAQTVVMGLTRVETKDDCRQFLDEHRILSWRNAMAERFHRSPIFDSEELWRVLCHELSVNIWEHARVPGFVAARVVRPFKDGKLRPWCRATYETTLGPLLTAFSDGFLELCVADMGPGFVATLEDPYKERAKVSKNNVSPGAVLCFAFDEFGTCKGTNESWATERHALGRILQIVAKYGGALTLRSGNAEVLYRTSGGPFTRIPNHLGYKPLRMNETFIPGAHLQLILPLIPIIETASHKESISVLNISLPTSFRTQSDQVRGHLIPLLEDLESKTPSVGATEQRSFRSACESLCRKLLKRSRSEPLVLDFGELNWTAAQFETLLHLLQNILQHRPVLLVEIDPQLAKEVDELEREAAPTTLDESLLHQESKSSSQFNELSEKVFLETFSRVHSPVIGLDQDGRRYLYGILNSSYKEPLLGLIDRESSIEELCSDTGGHLLQESTLRTILNRTNCVFELAPAPNPKRRWRCVWSAEALANEASRAISRHFDQVAIRSQAWRGKTGE